MVTFRNITEDNFDAVIRMKRPEGEGFVASNAVSLAQAWLYREAGDVFPFAICHGEEVVGFMLLEEDMDEETLILWRIMIDPAQERKGYGTAAVELLIRYAREAGRYRVLELDCAPENTGARRIYDRLGFRATGRMNHGSVEMQLPLLEGEVL